MFDNIALNSYYSNPMLSNYSSGAFTNPFGFAFNYSGDLASLGLFSYLNYGSYSGFNNSGAIPLMNMYGNWGGIGLPIFPSLADAYNGFAGSGAYMFPYSVQNSAPKFQFSVPDYPVTAVTRSGGGSNHNTGINTNVSRQPVTLSAEFINKVKSIAKDLNCNYDDLLAVINSESGFNPKAVNRSSGAVGLIQFTSCAIKDLNRIYGLNLTKEKIYNMSAMEQLDLVHKYLKIAKNISFPSSARLSAGDLYAILFLPGRASNNVLTKKGEAYYDAQPSLDYNKDGCISKQDLAQRVNSKRISVVA